ncbi:MAG: hypothetical protein LBU13_05395 [Synergistaceae bacterium]|nr:hypothetical protein [Synergistaceae bacterium]
MIINGIEVKQYELSYDKILKNTLEQNDEMTIRFINGVFGDGIPLDAKVEWLDKESIDDEYKAIVADFYPRIAGRMYSIEVEQDDKGGMAIRVFKYALGGALRHSMTVTDSTLTVKFPQPCVIYLKSDANTPKKLIWSIEFFDGQTVTLDIPTIRLAELSVKEMAERNLFPIGQFYLRTFEPLTKRKLEDFKKAGAELLAVLKDSMVREVVPYHLAIEMQDTIRKTAENTINRAGMEVDLDMATNIVETLPWIDYREVFKKIEERGKTERELEIAENAFRNADASPSMTAKILKAAGIPDEIIKEARKHALAEHSRQPKQPSEQER